MERVGDAMPIAELLDERRHLLEVARWMLGDRVAAERVTDEAYRQWFGLCAHERARIRVPRAWLTQAVGRISLERLGPSGSQGSVPGSGPCDTCVEDEVGDLLLRPEDIVRVRRESPASAGLQYEIAHAVRQACAEDDSDRLVSLLAPDVTAVFDGGGKIRALTSPVIGSQEVALSLLSLLARHPRTTLRTWPVNGATGLVARYGDQVAAVVTLDVAGPRVVQVWVVLNPDKLRSWNHSRP
ncbi:RNA polymerase subunit sigma [Streptomyces sp. TLI_185]|uniref:RNA polymerase subunit sigma n=1 Tax=Streptomyces sp. TLI_185 TaxID=2485151 RepID=UPI000F503047|nr:RNA polymerase subunit sigma [Streptomyces sp. TLI_185]RPF30471.1 RNA polymerase sigma-70 factor (ECF subfamily) [Streptomyces sp. TLI_185]